MNICTDIASPGRLCNALAAHVSLFLSRMVEKTLAQDVLTCVCQFALDSYLAADLLRSF